jgi:outer membrane PBP1 activator LpoA protein
MRCGVLHRWLVVPLAAAVLYGGAPAMASESAVTAPAAPPPSLEAPVALPPPTAARDRKPPAAAIDDPHFALLLPLDSKVFARHAEAVRNGFLAAAKVQRADGLPVRIYAVGDDPGATLEAYIKALASGAKLVVGPLTRNGVQAIMESAATLVPTLALNVPEGGVKPPPEIYVLSLQVEAEARQVAQRAWQDGYRKAVTINGDTPLLKRMHQAFVDEFARLGGAHAGAYAYSPDPENLAGIKKSVDASGADMGFLALDFARARLARPYLGSLPVYATSQVHPGAAGLLAGFDLAGVRFLDMPWLLQPDHPAVMGYPRAQRDDIELERFYALGIDAYRIALALHAGRADAALDGVTGRLTLGGDRRFTRGLTTAQFSEGKLTVVRERP